MLLRPRHRRGWGGWDRHSPTTSHEPHNYTVSPQLLSTPHTINCLTYLSQFIQCSLQPLVWASPSRPHPSSSHNPSQPTHSLQRAPQPPSSSQYPLFIQQLLHTLKQHTQRPSYQNLLLKHIPSLSQHPQAKSHRYKERSLSPFKW